MEDLTALFSIFTGNTGNLPARRHSAQEEARTNPKGSKKKEDSLDIPIRNQRHHSCDYNINNPNLLIATT